MNPHDLLSAEHTLLKKEALELQSLIDIGGVPLSDKLRAFQQVVQRHFQKEELYYRILDDEKRLQDRELVHKLRNDHAAIIFSLESLLIRLRKNGTNPDWRTRFKTMMDVFLPHLHLEDTVLFPNGKQILTPKELDQIAAHIKSCE